MRAARWLFERPAFDRRALRGYRNERITEVTVPAALALMEGGFVGVLADKVYHVHPVVLAVITAAPMFSNLSSFVWARLAHGRRKVPFITTLQVAMLALIALVALAPEGRLGAGVLVGAMIGVRLLLAGTITVRSTVWSLNYPREVRARVTSRLQILTTLTMTVASLAASRALDASPESFRMMYAAAAGIAAIGVVAFTRVPHLGERELLALERGEIGEGSGRAPSVVAILRQDANFARYQACQFVLGVSNMMVEAPLIYLVSNQMGASYTVSIAITLVLPLFLSTLTLPLWAVYIDRVHVARFRARQGGFWILAQALMWAGALEGSLWLLACGRVVIGLARGGGSLAWALGHNDFSNQRDLAGYMGAHVTLTGLRGSFAPFLGMLLFLGWQGGALPVVGWQLPALPALGAHVFGLSLLLAALSAVGFVILDRHIRV